ncbi:MAG: sugar transferase [Oceanicaulis sp.]
MPFDNGRDLAAGQDAPVGYRIEQGADGVRTAAKRAFDLTLAVLLAPAVGLMVLIIALIIRVFDGHPVLFSQMRVGLGGRVFRCWKLRTMVPGAEDRLEAVLARDPAAAQEWALYQKLRNDPRVTPLGRVLRKTSLDELPQLWNVLRGEMSLVGPRPIVPDEIVRYGDSIRHYYGVRPGVTGLWQVSGRSGTSYQERVDMDRTYAETWTLLGDCGLILRTVSAVISRRGAH